MMHDESKLSSIKQLLIACSRKHFAGSKLREFQKVLDAIRSSQAQLNNRLSTLNLS
jgi:hypothetical protein